MGVTMDQAWCQAPEDRTVDRKARPVLSRSFCPAATVDSTPTNRQINKRVSVPGNATQSAR